MAERQFMIVIRNETGENENGAGAKVGGAGGIKNATGGKKKASTYGEKIGEKFEKMLKPAAAYGTARRVMNLVVNHNNSLIEVTTGSREQQERTTYLYNTIGSYVDSAVYGAISGFALGGVGGAAIGAVLGVATKFTSELTNYAMASDTLAKQRALENISRDMAAQRATVSGSRYMNATQM